MKIFNDYNLGSLKLKNRIVMAPMCMYMAEDGLANDFHNIHYGNRALGEVGLIIVEATAVTKSGMITDKDLGIWSDDQIKGHKNITDIIKKYGSKAAIQLGHAGRKCSVKGLTTVAPSAIRYSEDYPVPKEMEIEDIKRIVQEFKDSARRSVDAGYEFIEIHGAHGYLLHEFLSPLTNQRKDSYGGDTKNRVRLIKEVISAVKSVVPKDFPVGIRISASDYKEGGIDIDEMIKIIDLIKEDLDIIHVSSGGLVEDQEIDVYPGYQVRFSEEIKNKCNVDTMAVGLITTLEEAEEIIGNDRADLVSLGRVLIRNPYIILNEDKEKVKSVSAYKRGFLK
ncbi:MAG: NADPH dehydrogenase NamA [Clostridium sp.]|nr:NADPH dehydrogenase NamA [Clostridium sp.]